MLKSMIFSLVVFDRMIAECFVFFFIILLQYHVVNLTFFVSL